MNVEEFFDTEEILAIHCNSMDKAKRLLKIFTQLGKTWKRDNIPYTQSGWSIYRESMCYDNKGTFGQVVTYRMANIKIIEFDELDEFLPLSEYTGGKPNTLTFRAWKTYNLIKKNSSKGEWTSKKDIIDNDPFNPQKNVGGYIAYDRKHDLCAGVWEDIESINMCPVIEKIVISDGKNNFKLATDKEEARHFIDVRYKNKLIKAATRYWTMSRKINRDGQGKLLDTNLNPIDDESKARDFVESFIKENK